MRSRTQNHPSVSWFEVDLSQYTDEVNSTTSLIVGFSHQGVSQKPYEFITSTESLRNTLGEPKTEAERYAYYAAKRVLTQKGKLVFVRIPYANEMEKVVPAFRYFIDEGKMEEYTGDKAYIPTTVVTDDVVSNLANMGLKSLSAISGHFEVDTTEVSSKEVFNGYSTVTKLKYFNDDGTPDTSKDKDIKHVWGSSTSSSRFVVLVDSEEIKDQLKQGTGKCNANEDSRFIAVTNVSDEQVLLENLINPSGYDFRGETQIMTADIQAEIWTAITAALKEDVKIPESMSGTVEIVEGTKKLTYTVVDVDDSATLFEKFESLGGTTDNVEGMFLTQGLRNGFYPKHLELKVNAFASYKYTLEQGGTQYSSEELSKTSQNAEKWVTVNLSNVWDKYLRTADSKISTATLYREKVTDTSTIKGVDGFFGKGYVPEELKDIERIVRIHRTDKYGYVDANAIRLLRDGDTENIGDVMNGGTGFILVNSSNHVLRKDEYNNNGEEVLGVVPFVFTGFNKLAASRLITPDKTQGNTAIYQAVQGLDTGANEGGTILQNILDKDGFQKAPFTLGSFDVGDDTISNMVASYFPTLVAGDGGKLPGDAMNQTAILVAELKTDPNYDNKVVVTVRELFYGNWDKDSANYLPNLVNENSEYVELYTNYTPSATYTKDLDKMLTVVTPMCDTKESKNFWFLDPTYADVMGYAPEQITKLIKYYYITDTLDKVANVLGNIDELDIDLVVDAGLTTIADSCVRAMGGQDNATGTKYNTQGDGSDDKYWYPTLLKGNNIKSASNIAVWKTIASKLNTFCEVTRKDCLALIDAPRNLTLNYNSPIVKRGGDKTIDADILPKLKYLTGLNSTYGTLNTTWIKEVDDFTGAQFWCPPSVLKAEKTVWCDQTYGYPWYVAAGTERGTLGDAVEVSMNPYPAQEDVIYANGFNYVKQFKTDGIVIWGQKTLQSAANTSMLGRENVRRMFLYAERKCYKAVKRFLFKPITTALMNNVVDTLTPIMQDIQDHEGCYDFTVLCNSKNNSAESIMRNELRIGIAIHPTPLAEYIILGFLCVGLQITITEDLIVANT